MKKDIAQMLPQKEKRRNSGDAYLAFI